MSSVGSGHYLAGRALGRPCEQRHNVLPHPRPADLGLDPFLRLDIGECENEDRVGLIELDEAGVEPTGLDDCPYGVLRRFDHRRGNRLRKRQMITAMRMRPIVYAVFCASVLSLERNCVSDLCQIRLTIIDHRRTPLSRKPLNGHVATCADHA